MSLEFLDIDCPYCGERMQVAVDASAGDSQHYIEDCAVCCQPIALRVQVDARGDIGLGARRGDDG